MRLDHSFTVPVPVDEAWAVLLDVPRIAPCMPGAALTEFDGEAFNGTVKVKLGPISLTYKGKGRFVERDEAARRVVVEASGRDVRAAGTAAATVTAVLAADGADGDSTRVDVTTDLTVTGRPAQFGRGMLGDVSGKLLNQFAECLARKLAEQPAAAPDPATSDPSPSPSATATASPNSSSPAAPETASATPSSAPPAPAPEAGSSAPPASTPVSADPAPSPNASTPSALASPAATVTPAPSPGPSPSPPSPSSKPPSSQPPSSASPSSESPAEAVAAPARPPAVAPPSPGTSPAARSSSSVSARTPDPESEVEPIDLLQITGISGAARRYAPYGLVVLVFGVLAWLIIRSLRSAN